MPACHDIVDLAHQPKRQQGVLLSEHIQVSFHWVSRQRWRWTRSIDKYQLHTRSAQQKHIPKPQRQSSPAQGLANKISKPISYQLQCYIERPSSQPSPSPQPPSPKPTNPYLHPFLGSSESSTPLSRGSEFGGACCVSSSD